MDLTLKDPFINRFFQKISLSFAALLLITGANFAVFAKTGNDFSAPYGLLVHTENQDLPVSRIKGLEVLIKFFKNISAKPIPNIDIHFSDILPSDSGFPYAKKGCALGLFDCKEAHFYPDDDLAQQDFLVWFFRLRYHESPKTLELQYPKTVDESKRSILEARRLNLLSDSRITYQSLQDFLYRYAVSEANLSLPYSPILFMDPRDIKPEKYHNLKEIQQIQEDLEWILFNYEGRNDLTSKEKAFESKLDDELLAFEKLEKSLDETPYLLSSHPGLDPQVAHLVQHFKLQDVLSSLSYDYSKNPAYRKYNMLTGIKKVHAKLLMPSEILDFWKQISDKNLWDFKYGWVIADGGEEWAFGGGICGSATLLFIPTWKSGLEVVERQNHSLFYSSLYPKEDIGLDATVFRPKPDLKIRNNLDSPVVFNVVDDPKKQIVTVEIFGNRSAKSSEIEGPIFVTHNNVKWTRSFEWFDGSTSSDTLESHYNAIY
jgi:VanW like protein